MSVPWIEQSGWWAIGCRALGQGAGDAQWRCSAPHATCHRSTPATASVPYIINPNTLSRFELHLYAPIHLQSDRVHPQLAKSILLTTLLGFVSIESPALPPHPVRHNNAKLFEGFARERRSVRLSRADSTQSLTRLISCKSVQPQLCCC